MHFLQYNSKEADVYKPSTKHTAYKTIADALRCAQINVIGNSDRYVLLVTRTHQFVIASDINNPFYYTDIPTDLITVINCYNVMREF